MIPHGITESEYEACIDNLGLVEGEIKLQYVGSRPVVSVSSWDGQRQEDFKPGLLVFTNDSMIFMQREGKDNYAQAIRVPLENLSGVVTGGTFIHHVMITVGTAGASEQHKFVPFPFAPAEGGPLIKGGTAAQRVRADIEKLLRETREERKRLAMEALAKGTAPAMIFCKFCGTRNKADQSKCSSCGAPLG